MMLLVFSQLDNGQLKEDAGDRSKAWSFFTFQIMWWKKLNPEIVKA